MLNLIFNNNPTTAATMIGLNIFSECTARIGDAHTNISNIAIQKYVDSVMGVKGGIIRNLHSLNPNSQIYELFK